MIKLFKLTLPLTICFLWIGLVSGGNDDILEAQMSTLKQECKEMIKGTRYEGSKITYYTVGSSKQTKSIEVYTFLLDEYKFAISAKKCATSLTIKIYDTPDDDKERVLIKEFKKAQGKNLKFSTTELNNLYQEKNPDADRLRNIHIEYSIGSGKAAKEGIVLVYGIEP
jgi:hypothetical protein